MTSFGPINQGDPPSSNLIFWGIRYAPEYSGFDGRDMTPGDPIEHYPTGITENPEIIPEDINLSQNFPNPFNASTMIEFSLNRAENINLKVYDILGRKIATLISGQMSAGVHRINFDASRFSSGYYFYKLQIGDYSETKRMMLLK